MALYFGTTEITNIDNLVPQTGLDITDIWFGETNVYTVWATYEGALPVTLIASGTDMRQYQIYGNVGGVGDKTINLYSGEYILGYYLNSNGKTIKYSGSGGGNLCVSSYTPIVGDKEYTFEPNSSHGMTAYHAFYDSNKQYISAVRSDVRTFTTPHDCAFLRLSFRDTSYNIMLNEGSIALPYEPYGYKLDMVSSNGTTSTTTTIYIGDDPLEKDEYVDYQAGKVYRRTENIFNINDLWDKGQVVDGAEASKFLEIAVQNGTYTAGTNVPNNSNPDIASVFIASSIESNPPSSTAGVFINRPRTITTTTGKIYIGIRVRSAGGYQIFSKETFAPYYINVVSGSEVPTTAIPYLQPTDPPVSFPALTTIEGTTIVDYAGSGTAPEKVIMKYRKENF